MESWTPLVYGAIFYGAVLWLASKAGEYFKDCDRSAPTLPTHPSTSGDMPTTAICAGCDEYLPVYYWYGGKLPYCVDCGREMLNK